MEVHNDKDCKGSLEPIQDTYANKCSECGVVIWTKDIMVGKYGGLGIMDDPKMWKEHSSLKK